MATLKPNLITIGGHDIPQTLPFEIKFIRGLAPYRFEFPIDPTMLGDVQDGDVDATTGAVNIEAMPPRPEIIIKTANVRGTGEDTLKIEGWYFLGVKLAKGGHYVGMMADPRFGLNFQKLSGAFNTRGFNGLYKTGTTNGGNPWKIGEFIGAAFSLIGRGVTISDKVDSSILDAPLPDNFSNVSSGMIFGAAAPEWLPKLLEGMRADLTIDKNGGFHIVERSDETAIDDLVDSNNKSKQGDLAGLDEETVIGKHDIHWQKPAIVRVLFRKQIERRLKILGNGFTQVIGDDLYLKNVAVPYTFDANGVPQIDNAKFDDIGQVIIDHVRPFASTFDADRWLRERVLRPSMINLQGADVVEQRQKTNQLEVIRLAFRRWWQIQGIKPSDHKSHRKVYSKLGNIRFGRISEDGSVNAPAVFGTWVERRRYGLEDDKSKHVLDQKFTVNHPYPSPAPFEATWLDEEQGVLQLKPNSDSIFMADAYVGQLRKPATFGTLDEVLRGLPIRFTNYGEFGNKEKADIYYVAEVIQPYKDIAGQSDGGGLLYEVSTTIGNAGATGVVAVEYRVDELFANYQMKESSKGSGIYRWPGFLMNKAKLEAKAKEIVERVELQFQQARSGVIKYGGIRVFKNVPKPNGSIYEIAIKVGDKKAFGITTVLTVLPEVRKKVRPAERVHREVQV